LLVNLLTFLYGLVHVKLGVILGAAKKIAIGITILVMAGIIMLFINTTWSEYAEVGYQLQGPKSLDLNYESSLEVDLRKKNDGNIGAVPISKIYVLNATIVQVSINGIAQHQLSKYCYFNETMATISNLTIAKGRSLSVWATIYVVPNEEVASFTIYADVGLRSDWLHPRNNIMRILPTELIYNCTSANNYSLLE
jgi:hypothetical protein